MSFKKRIFKLSFSFVADFAVAPALALATSASAAPATSASLETLRDCQQAIKTAVDGNDGVLASGFEMSIDENDKGIYFYNGKSAYHCGTPVTTGDINPTIYDFKFQLYSNGTTDRTLRASYEIRDTDEGPRLIRRGSDSSLPRAMVHSAGCDKISNKAAAEGIHRVLMGEAPHMLTVDKKSLKYSAAKSACSSITDVSKQFDPYKAIDEIRAQQNSHSSGTGRGVK